MGIVGVDSSGLVGDPPIHMAAVKKVNIQKHSIIYLSKERHDEYRDRIDTNWREKLSAVLMFKAIEPIISLYDIIQIDLDFQGWRKTKVEAYLRKLFGKNYYGKHPLNNPIIQFLTKDLSNPVKWADKKSKMSRHKEIKNSKCPNLWKYLSWLK